MPRKNKDRSDQLRTLIAQEAAKIIVQQGVRDYLLAKQKAAERMGLTDRSQLPRNTEIENAVIDYQRLFSREDYPARLDNLRGHARQAMVLFKHYQPRLVGSLLNGSISENSSIDIHLFSDTVEEIVLHLMQHTIPYEEGEWSGRHANGERKVWPRLSFFADTIDINLIIFPPKGLRQAPLSPVDGKPMRRATLAEVETFLEAL